MESLTVDFGKTEVEITDQKDDIKSLTSDTNKLKSSLDDLQT